MAAALWSTIRSRNRLIVNTRHHPVGDGFVPCEFGSPGPRAHCIPMDRAPGLPPTAVRPRLPANAKFPRLGWEKNAPSTPRSSLPTPWADTPRLPVSEHGLAVTVGRTAYAPIMSARAGTPNSQGTKPSPTESWQVPTPSRFCARIMDQRAAALISRNNHRRARRKAHS